MNPRARGFFYAPLVMDALDRPWDKKVVRIILEEITADKSVECETYWIELLRMCQHPLRNKRLPSPIWHEKRQKYADSVKARSRILHADELNTDASGE
jgi:hypothetical protein